MQEQPYTGGLIARYADLGFPAWAFIEVVSFGSFLYFYKFCAKRFNDREMLNEFYIFQAVKSLRNACAHNNCILNNLSAGKPIYEPRYDGCKSFQLFPASVPANAGQRCPMIVCSKSLRHCMRTRSWLQGAFPNIGQIAWRFLLGE